MQINVYNRMTYKRVTLNENRISIIEKTNKHYNYVLIKAAISRTLEITIVISRRVRP